MMVSEETGRQAKTTQISDLRRVRRVLCTKDDTTIVEGKREEAQITDTPEKERPAPPPEY